MKIKIKTSQQAELFNVNFYNDEKEREKKRGPKVPSHLDLLVVWYSEYDYIVITCIRDA
jgi:hypothetical protein